MKNFIKKYKFLLIGGFIIACAGAAYMYSELMRKPANAGDKTADFTITAEQLQKDFENEEEASKKYMDKVLQVSGTISDITSNEKSTDISLETPDPITVVTIQVLPEEKDKAAKYKTGDKISVKGICTGKLTDIELNKGVIVQ